MNEKAEDLAYGEWPKLLTARGIDASYFSGKPGPCPLCMEGKDRYRWVQKKYGGVYVCNVCTDDKYATGFNMLMKHMGYKDFIEAANDVRDFFAANPEIKPISRERIEASRDEWSPEKIARNRQRMQKLWDESRSITQGDPVWLYMRNRVPGFELQVDWLRYHPALEYWDKPPPGQDKPVLLGKFPAMLAYALDQYGELAQLHKTYLTNDGHKAAVPLAKKTDLGIGTNSFAVRMMEPTGDTLAVCEGLETGWASAMLKGVPVWPCLNGPVMSEFVLPEYLRGQIKKLIVFKDNDEAKPSGRKPDGSVKYRRAGAAYAEKLVSASRSRGLRTLTIGSARVGDDIADYWERAVAA